MTAGLFSSAGFANENKPWLVGLPEAGYFALA